MPGAFGCVLFDVKEVQPGKWEALPGPAWVSVEGEKATRIQGVEDLDSNRLWLSNLDRKIHWKAGLFTLKHIKDSRYLRVDLYQIARELGWSPKKIGSTKTAQAISEVFARVCRLAKDYAPELDYMTDSLANDLVRALDIKPYIHADETEEEAFACSYQDRTVLTLSDLPAGEERWVTFRIPRLYHVNQILGETSRLPQGPWKMIPEAAMPAKNLRMQWVYDNFRDVPFMVKVRKMQFYGQENQFRDLFRMDEVILAGRARRLRNWIPAPEFMGVRNFMDMDIESVCTGKEYVSASGIVPDFDPVYHHSYSYGLLMENVMTAYCLRSVAPKLKTKTSVSPWASWIRAYDRFFCLNNAAVLKPFSRKIASYGNGNVVVSTVESELEVLMGHATANGLQAPASTYSLLEDWKEKTRKSQENQGKMAGIKTVEELMK